VCVCVVIVCIVFVIKKSKVNGRISMDCRNIKGHMLYMPPFGSAPGSTVLVTDMSSRVYMSMARFSTADDVQPHLSSVTAGVTSHSCPPPKYT
jgi:hypothetical protein